ncbi:TadE/TadG family type IV pilus assembly protein [Paenibacillus sp. P46E]|uniref:TadE/TadG family type IV pilus assembly protein n=1 Tax=Paenibacillus sp. P46E TaxID=1349436 RepID=UPI00093917FA|nr:TadE family protein [Paenibacillus sp. P46E]OKP97445.1 pilus assembly protein TadE [Paenibacillus sp. P46E]
MSTLRKDEGSFTIEASLLLPIIMCITMLLLFFCLYSYQKSMLLQIASAATERAAYNWDNSHKETKGSYNIGEYDSLYWRIGDDDLLSSLFGIGAPDGGAVITLPAAGDGGTLPVVKLTHAASMVPANMPGEMNYAYSLTGRKVSAELKRVLNLPVLDEILSDKAVPVVQARSVIAEPVEFIRTVDLMRYYGAKFKGNADSAKSGTGMDKKNAAVMMSKLH